MHTSVRLAGYACVLLVITAATGCKKKKTEPPEPHAGGSILAVQAAPASAFRMSLTTQPAHPKFASQTLFRVRITDRSGRPVNNADAKISLVMPLMDMGKKEFPLKPLGDGIYAGAGEFTMAGEWEVNTVAMAGGQTGKYRFNLNVVE